MFLTAASVPFCVVLVAAAVPFCVVLVVAAVQLCVLVLAAGAVGKIKRNPNINCESMFGFRLVFQRVIKWPNVVLELDFGARFRIPCAARRDF